MKQGCTHINKGKQEKRLQAHSLRHPSLVVCVSTFVLFASAAALCTMDAACDGGDGCDPKGAGALTTSRRYSRIGYRQSDTFSDPRGISYPQSNIGQLDF